MKAKFVHEVLYEGYGSGFSMSSGGHFSGGMGGTTRGGFSGAGNMGGPNTMYTYSILPLNHTLEPLNNTISNQSPQIQIGSKISGIPVRSNATPVNNRVTGIVRKIETSMNGALKYYMVQDEATQNYIKIEPLSAKLLIAEPVQYYYDSTDNIPTRRNGRKIRVA